MIKRKDWRKLRPERTHPKLVVRWFHWSRRPRLYIHYYEASMCEMRHVAIDWKYLRDTILK